MRFYQITRADVVQSPCQKEQSLLEGNALYSNLNAITLTSNITQINHRFLQIYNKGQPYRILKDLFIFNSLLSFAIVEQMSENENYCRNPDQSVKPWCFVQGETGLLKEYCDIPSCGQFKKHFIFFFQFLLCTHVNKHA